MPPRTLELSLSDFPERFRSKVAVDPNTGCWIWTATSNPDGYGLFWYDKKMSGAHIAAFLLAGEEIPTGYELDHLCRVRACVNPAHLEAITHRENLRRGGAARQSPKCKKGLHFFTKANTYVQPNGNRICRKCQTARHRKYRALRA